MIAPTMSNLAAPTLSDDCDLLRQTARGDHGSLAQLHQRYSGVLMATAEDYACISVLRSCTSGFLAF